MNRLNSLFSPITGALLCAATLLGVLFTSRDLPAQTSHDNNWQGMAEARLKAIYDRGEFRAKNPQAA